MHLLSLASAIPTHRYSQAECLAIASASPRFQKLRPASLRLLDRILSGKSGIDERGFVFPDIEAVLSMDATALNRAFEREAPALAIQALEKALKQAGLKAAELDALLICTCTGYLCPGISSHVAQQAGLRADAVLNDLVGLGCGAAIPTLRAGANFLASQPEAKVACLAVEICSAAFYADDSADQLISLCLFGDAAACSIWGGGPAPQGAWQGGSFDTMHLPEHREKIRFVQVDGHLRNQLDRSVPKLAAQAVDQLATRAELNPSHEEVVVHGGGRDVLDQISKVLPKADLATSREILRANGNCSSPSVLLALEATLATEPNRDSIWMASFGAGFSAHSCRLTRSSGLRIPEPLNQKVASNL